MYLVGSSSSTKPKSCPTHSPATSHSNWASDMLTEDAMIVEVTTTKDKRTLIVAKVSFALCRQEGHSVHL